MSDRRPIDYADPDLYGDSLSYERLAKAATAAIKASFDYTPILSYDAVRAISKDTQNFSSEEKTILVATPAGMDLRTQRNFLLNMDEPRHGRVRGIVADAFSVRAVEGRRQSIMETVETTAAKIALAEPFEFVSGFATPVTLGIILMLMGLDNSDLDLIRKLTEEVVYTDDKRYNVTGQEGKHAAVALFTYAMQLYGKIDRQADDSVLRRLTEGVGDNRLSREEFCFFFTFILAAGYETTRSMLCNMMTILAESTALLSRVRANPDGLENLVEEMLRFDPPVLQMCRTAMRDVEVPGHAFHPGAKVGLVYPMANRDARVFEDPHKLCPERANASKHLSFGIGRHKCLGAHLAKLEMKCVLEVLARRFDRVEVLSIDRVRSNFTKSTRSMMVRFT